MRKKVLDPTSSPQAAFGVQLRRSREAKGYTQPQLAAKIPCDVSYISKLETAKEPPTRRMAVRCDEVLGTGGTLELMWRQIKHSVLDEGFPEYAELEAKADVLRLSQTSVVPGLLQTETYAAALMDVVARRGAATGEQIRERLAFRMARQAKVFERTPTPTLHAVLDESCVRRVIGGPKVMSDQLLHLERLAQCPNVVLQVAPFTLGEEFPFLLPVQLLTVGNRSFGYTETIDRGFLVRDREAVTAWSRDYDRLMAEALSATGSLELIRSVREELREHDRRDTAQRRRLAQVQLQRRERQRLHPGRTRIPRPRPRPGLQEP
jgi:transcriptional regulator with XRE-family HTH domain